MKTLSPEQKRRRWLILGIVAISYVLSFFQRFAPAGIAQDLASAFETSAASLGVLAATYFYVYTVMQVPTGILADTLGPRRILALGGLIGGAGSILFGFAPTLDVALFGRTMIGLGVSVTFIAMLKLIAVWFEEDRFATLVGVCMLIGNLGSVLAGAPLSALAQASGWRLHDDHRQALGAGPGQWLARRVYRGWRTLHGAGHTVLGDCARSSELCWRTRNRRPEV